MTGELVCPVRAALRLLALVRDLALLLALVGAMAVVVWAAVQAVAVEPASGVGERCPAVYRHPLPVGAP